MASTDPQPAPSGGLIRRTLRRRRMPILTRWALLTTALMCAAIVLVRGPYRSSSLIRVDPARADLYGVRTGDESIDSFLQTQVQLITSPNVLTAAGVNPKAAALPRIQKSGDVVNELRDAVTVHVIPGTYLIEVACPSDSAGEAATLVNAVVDAFIEANVEWSDGMTRTQIKNLESYLADLTSKIEEIERHWKELVARDEFVVKGQPARAAITLEQYKRVQKELFEANLELVQAEAWVSAVKNAVANAEKNPASLFEGVRLEQQVKRRFQMDPEVIRLAEEIDNARKRLEVLRRTSNLEGDPAQRAASEKLERLKMQYDQLLEARQKSIREQIEGAGASDPDRELREAEAKVLVLRVKQAALAGEFDRLELIAQKLPRAADEVDIALVRDQRESLRSMQDVVNRRLEQLKFESKGEARVRLVNKAVPAGRRMGVWYKPLVLLAIPFLTFAGVVGLFAAVQARSEWKKGVEAAKAVPTEETPTADEPPPTEG